jgi:hypothetical protein
MLRIPSDPAVLSVYAVSEPHGQIVSPDQAHSKEIFLTIIGCPCIRSISTCSVSQRVQNSLVWVLLGS